MTSQLVSSSTSSARTESRPGSQSTPSRRPFTLSMMSLPPPPLIVFRDVA
jgi:hypothetical protein